MALRLYNTLTKTKEDFVPLDPKNVRMYVCGPTVYDFAHIGNARPAIVFDVLFRLLKHLASKGEWDGGKGETKVTYVRNITDVDDKINARAAEQVPDLPLNEAIRSITQKTAQQYFDDVAALGCLPPDEQPRATEYIGQMIAMIERLIAGGHAYAAEGHVLYDVSSKPDYGKLARRSLDEMMAGARVEVAPYKRNAMDFVLWKPSDPSLPGWDSPWGRGRPGWHIECSAMSEALLCTPFHTDTFDIHGGGIDLVFPHHENEIAQSESAHHDHPFAKVWMHNGFLQVEGEKMSKSLGNFVTIRELLKTTKFGGFNWPGPILRYAMLSTHYRQPIDWTVTKLEEAAIALDGFRFFSEDDEDAQPSPEVIDALMDDMNTPKAITALHKLLNESRANPIQQPGGYGAVLRASCDFLGLNVRGVDLNKIHRMARADINDAEIDNLIDARNAARKAKDFKKSDEIRDELLAKGIVLKDGPDGTTWEVKR